MQWWSPDPRAIFELDRFHMSKRLQRTCRSEKFTVTVNQDFAGVIAGCATAQDRRFNTWLTPELASAYRLLGELGHAHSVEVWHAGELVGGVYGVSIGGLFAGESMFYRVRDASKVALAYLVNRLSDAAFGCSTFSSSRRTPAVWERSKFPAATISGACAKHSSTKRSSDGSPCATLPHAAASIDRSIRSVQQHRCATGKRSLPVLSSLHVCHWQAQSASALVAADNPPSRQD